MRLCTRDDPGVSSPFHVAPRLGVCGGNAVPFAGNALLAQDLRLRGASAQERFGAVLFTAQVGLHGEDVGRRAFVDRGGRNAPDDDYAIGGIARKQHPEAHQSYVGTPP